RRDMTRFGESCSCAVLGASEDAGRPGSMPGLVGARPGYCELEGRRPDLLGNACACDGGPVRGSRGGGTMSLQSAELERSSRPGHSARRRVGRKCLTAIALG